MITQEQAGIIRQELEFIPREQRPDWYLRLNEVIGFERLSRSELTARKDAWTQYYEKVRKTSPASMLFDEWKKWAKGTSSFPKEKLKEMTKDMMDKGLPKIPGEPAFPDPVDQWNIQGQAERFAKAVMKKQESTKKTAAWKE